MIAIDSNLLIYAHRSMVPEHERAIEILDEASATPGGWGIPFPCIAEFWSIVTHPTARGRPSTPAEASGFLNNLLRGGATILAPKAGAAHQVVRLATELGVVGRLIFDLQIALVSIEAGAQEIWTYDQNFVRLPGLGVRVTN